MDIPTGTRLHYKKNADVEIIGREPWFEDPVAVCVALGKYFHHQDRAKHYEHFDGSNDVNRWLRDQQIIFRDDAPASHETLTLGDGLVSLIMAAEKVQASKAY